MRNRTFGVVAALVAAVVFTGCQQPQPGAPNQQQARLLTAQNADLQKQLEAKQAEIKTLQDKYNQELRKRDQELIRCKVRIDSLQQEVKKAVAERAKSITAPVLDENAKLRRENEQLKAEIEKLKAGAAKDSK